MPYFTYHGTLNIVHSDLYYKIITDQDISQTYWNVTTDDGDVIPVISCGYKKREMVEKRIKGYFQNVKEIVFLHKDTEEKLESGVSKYSDVTLVELSQ